MKHARTSLAYGAMVLSVMFYIDAVRSAYHSQADWWVPALLSLIFAVPFANIVGALCWISMCMSLFLGLGAIGALFSGDPSWWIAMTLSLLFAIPVLVRFRRRSDHSDQASDRPEKK